MLETLLELDFRLPSKKLSSLGDIRLPLFRIIGRKWFEDDLGLRVYDILHGFGKLENGVLAWVADINWAHVLAVHKADKSLDLVVDIAEAAGLVAFTIHGNGLTPKGLDDEVADYTTIVLKHTRTVRVEDTCDTDLKLMLTVVLHTERFGNTFPLIVAGADADRVDISPVFLNLRVNFWIPVDFRGRRDKESGLASLRETKHIHGAKHVGLDSFYGVFLVEDRGGWASKMVHLIDFQLDRVNYVVADELEAGVADVLIHI
mmetsp:Transcript_14832/g.28210  ORF Transcript_14832/g.28210 Transcript_14832/m.28210 type:complete len:260 (-) Transcript_14832:35-814(-)